jgi:uncharacterized protein (DUF1778 family)
MTSHQINIKVSSDDLKYIDAKAKRYGLSRSAMIKVFALNAEMKVIVSGEFVKLLKISRVAITIFIFGVLLSPSPILN